MSLRRLAFRALTVQALSKQPGEDDYPTIARDLVFDSRIDPINFEQEKIEVPIIAVYTDRDHWTLKDTAAGRGALMRLIDLRIDFALASFSKKVVDRETQIEYGLPSTDAELEALLDIFEAQIWRALFSPGRAVSNAWSGMVIQFRHMTSTGHSDANNANKLAARSIDLQVEVLQDCWPKVTLDDVTLPNPSLEKIRCEVPWVAPLLDQIADDPAYRSVTNVLTDAAGGASIVLPHLTSIRAGYHSALTTESDVIANFLQGKPTLRKPIHVQANWSLP
jgi:hypothetical protein